VLWLSVRFAIAGGFQFTCYMVAHFCYRRNSCQVHYHSKLHHSVSNQSCVNNGKARTIHRVRRAPIYYDVRLKYTRFDTASPTTRRYCNPHGEGNSSPRTNLFCSHERICFAPVYCSPVLLVVLKVWERSTARGRDSFIVTKHTSNNTAHGVFLRC
jgi:hypothetical protein